MKHFDLVCSSDELSSKDLVLEVVLELSFLLDKEFDIDHLECLFIDYSHVPSLVGALATHKLLATPVVRGLAVLSMARVCALVISMLHLLIFFTLLSLLSLLFLYQLLISLLLYYYVLGFLAADHPSHEPSVVKLLNCFVSLDLLKAIEFINVGDERRNDLGSTVVLAKESTGPDLVSAARTLLFDFAIVVLDA